MIATIVNYCTNDYRFLSSCIEAIKPFSSQVIVSVSDHFFNGEIENQALLSHSYDQHRDVTFTLFHFDPKKPYGFHPDINQDDPDFVHYWHSTARYVGSHFVRPEISHILFIDVDEIVETARFIAWLKSFPYETFDAIRFSSYLYFRESKYRSHKWLRNGLMVKKSALSHEMLLDTYERKGTFYQIRGSKITDVTGLDGRPLFHHYSWVKTKEEILKKVTSWGHHLDRNWSESFEEELQGPFRGKDLVFGFSYDEVEALHDPLGVSIPTEQVIAPFPHVILVDKERLQRINLGL